MLPSRGLSGGTGLPAVPRPRCVTANARPGSLVGLQPGRQPVPGQLDAVQPHEQDVGPVRVAGIDDIAALLPPALARQPLALEQALGQVKVRLRADPPRDPAEAWRGGVVDGMPAHLKQDERRGGITLAVQLCDPPLPLPQPQSEHATVEGKRPAEVPQLTATEQIPVS